MRTYGAAVPSLGEVVARTVRAERAAHGWTQEYLAARAGMTQKVLSGIETEKRQVRADDLVPLCQALGITLAELLARVDADDKRVLGL